MKVQLTKIRSLIIALMFIAPIYCQGEANSDQGASRLSFTAGINYDDFLLIEKAVAKAENNIPVKLYKIYIFTWNGNLGVIFRDKRFDPIEKNELEDPRPTYEVSFDENGDLIRAGFSR